MPKSNDPERNRHIFLKLMLMDDIGLLKQKEFRQGRHSSSDTAAARRAVVAGDFAH